MNLKEVLISILLMSIIVIFPHTGLIPNFGYSLVILFIVWIYLKLNKKSFNDIGFNFKRFKPKSILTGVLVAALTICFMQLVFFPILEYFVILEDTDIGLYDFIRSNKWQYLFIVIMGWLVGGFYEEIVFHGFIYTQLEKLIPGKSSTRLSFIITAILFGAYHFQLGWGGLINAFLVGAVYLWLFQYFKRNLWYSIICHGTYNTIVITMIYLGYL